MGENPLGIIRNICLITAVRSALDHLPVGYRFIAEELEGRCELSEELHSSVHQIFAKTPWCKPPTAPGYV